MGTFELEGVQVGNYRLVAPIGRGAFGATYRATRDAFAPTDDVPQSVAVKLIPLAELDPSAVRRFQRETETGHSIAHRNLVHTYASGQAKIKGNECAYLVMEFVAGLSLREYLSRYGAVPESLCLHIAREVLLGLRELHDRHIVHRDINPSNVIITYDETVKLMDFGLARTASFPSDTHDPTYYVGNRLYGAPEQLRPGCPVDARADLYAIGLLLQELATGRARSLDFQIERAGRVVPEPSSFNPRLSSEFDHFVTMLRSRSVDNRPEDAAAALGLLDELQRKADRATGGATATRTMRMRIVGTPTVARRWRAVGNEPAIEKLRESFEAARFAAGRPLLVCGEGGLGKSRLLSEFVAYLAGRGLDCLIVSVVPRSDLGDTLLSSLLRSVSGLASSDWLDTALATGDPSGILRAALREISTHAPAMGASEELETSLADTLGALSTQRPTVLLVDDLHAASGDASRLLTRLSEVARRTRLVVVATSRPAAGAGLADYERLDLSRLTAGETSRLAAEYLDCRTIGTRLERWLGERVPGVPLHVIEALRLLTSSGHVRRTLSDTYDLVADDELPSVETSLETGVSARLRSMSSRNRDVAHAAACIGYVFDPSVVAGMVGIDDGSALFALAELEREGVVLSLGQAVRFDHVFIYEAVLESIPDDVQRSWHVRACETLLTRLDREGERSSLRPLLVEQLVLAGRVSEAAARAEGALAALTRAYDEPRALQLLTQILANNASLAPDRRARLLMARAQRLELLGRQTEEEEDVLAALREAWTTTDPELVRSASNAAAWHYVRVARYEEARDILNAALALPGEGDRREFSEHMRHLGSIAYFVGDYRESVRCHTTHLDIAIELGDVRREMVASGNLGNAWRQIGDWDRAETHCKRAIALGEALNDDRGVAFATGSLGKVLRERGNYRDAETAVARWLEMVREMGDRRAEARGLNTLGEIRVAIGDTERALRTLEDALALSMDVRAVRTEASALHRLARAYEQRLDYGRAIELYRRALDIRDRVKNDAGVAETSAYLAGLLIEREPNEARRLAEHVEFVARANGLHAPGLLASLRLTQLGATTTQEAEESLAMRLPLVDFRTKIEALALAWQVLRTPRYVDEAYGLLNRLRANLPTDVKPEDLGRVPLFADIIAAYATLTGQ